MSVAQPAAAQTFIDAERDGLVALASAPPADNSLAGTADLEAVFIVEALRTPELAREAALDGDMPPLDWARRALGPGYDPARQPAAFALFEAVRADMTRTVDVIKARGPQRARPHQRDPRVRPSLSIEGHGTNSWPSGRAAATRVWADVLADLFPERANSLRAAASRSAQLRVIGGVHYPTDLIAGFRLADVFLERLHANPLYQCRLAAAREGRVGSNC
ncbi:hypothetical protein RCO27_03950 [Sphingosinicella sp. LHD-64]|uniref:phosphatase PAP2 family protein n=1 Tax=Sphingosinicella sp. LHD-64 TaxID=3072139 RepID=UPI00281080BE|nr:phosphatase PAP2 family protein [Sphingosinicella sp. LHD-64]MDQ8755373.1 hypothetical protein [Sphingosinicella sp. LHD-64]